MIIGIDLGTTFSLVAAFTERGPVVLPNALGEALTPSAVAVTDDGTVLIGAPARARFTTHPERVARSFKRDMGTARRYSLGGKEFRPEELSALVLGALKRDAEAALGHEVREAVVTVPAYFGDSQRQATRDAGAIAGLVVERIINEPTAAALAYGLHERGRERRAVVLDLGGGTFDVTVLEIIEGVIEIQGSSGNTRLGGDDFDRALAEHLLRRIERELGVPLGPDPRLQARVLAAAEDAKKRLSYGEATRLALVDLPTTGGAVRSVELGVTRDEAEEVWADLLAEVRGPVLRALSDASTTPSQIDEVILVGGSTRMPAIARLAAQIFGRLPSRTLPPDEAVALGAAVQGALKQNHQALDDLVVTDIAPFTLGIATATLSGEHAIKGVFTPLLERGTVIPASRAEVFQTMADGQREVVVEVYQGEHSLCADNQRLGEYRVRGIPPRPAGEQSIEIRFTYDLNGLLEVETTVLSTRRSETLVIERAPGRMSRKEVEQARRAMVALKHHPRDALPNTVALDRADALYVELSGEARLLLGREIARFRAALESQRPEVIAPTRDQLIALCNRLRQGA